MSANNSEHISVKIINAKTIKQTTETPPEIPIFTYQPSNFKKHSDGTISVANEVIHTILDDKEFYESLGYQCCKERNATFDEYIWERYSKDRAQGTKNCMQTLIRAYLYKHSKKFRELYGDAYEKLIDCDSNFVCIDYVSGFCDSCPQVQSLSK